MNSIDIVLMGLKNLYRRKGRTFLTVLGVIIGTAAIITMISIGLGIKNTFLKQVKKYGSLTTINIYPSNGGMKQSGAVYSQSKGILEDKAVKSLENLENVEAVIPILQTDGRIVSGKYVNNISIKGIKPDQMKYLGIKLSSGTLLTNNGEGVVFGSQVGMNFYNPSKRNNYSSIITKPKVNILSDRMFFTVDYSYGEPASPIGDSSSTSIKKVKGKLHNLKTVGVIQQGEYENDYIVFMGLDIVKKYITEKNAFNKASGQGGNYGNSQTGYSNLMVKVKDMKYVRTIQDAIKAMGYEAYSQIDSLNEVEKVSNIIQLVLGGIAAISLFVASLGITNTMIMAIYERTREIGIMKVIGASLGDIKKMFLFEAALIGLLGGIIGSMFSYLASYILNNVLSRGFMGSLGGLMQTGATDIGATKISIIPIWLIGFALAFTTLIGIISGYYPAKRAMKLSALEAIKTE